MIGVADDTLTWVYAAPIFASLVLFAFGRAPLLWTRLLIALVMQGIALGTSLLLSAKLFGRGGFALFDVDGWAGARITAVDPTGAIATVLGPSQVPLLVAVHIAGLLATGLVTTNAKAARSSAGTAAVLLGVGLVALLVVARDTVVICAAFSASALAGFTLLVCFHPLRPEVEGAVRVFIIHRVGDALVVVAFVIVGASTFPALGDAGAVGGGPWSGGLALEALAASAPAFDPWLRAAAGPFAGFAARELWALAAALVAAGAATRIIGIPLAREAVGAPGSAVGLAHGVCFAGASLVLLWRAAPLLWLAPEVLTGLAVVGAAGALVTAGLAASARDVVRIDVLLLGGFASLGAIAAAAADAPTLLLATIVLIVGAVPLCAATGAVVQETGRADPHSLGGLEKTMPRTHTTRLLAGGAMFGPLFGGAVIGAHVVADLLLAPWLGSAALGGFGPALLLGVLASLAGLALAAFRPLHLAFTGKAAREPLPRAATDPPAARTLPALALALALLGAGLAHLPHGVLALLPNVETYRSPLAVLTLPERAELQALRDVVLPAAVRPDMGPLQVLLLVVAALTLGWLASTVVYRGGPGRVHHALVGGRRARSVVALVAGVAGGENQVVRGVGEGAIRLSRMIATNLAPGVLDTLLRRLPSLFGFIVGFVVRLIANGSAQRGIAVAVLVLVALLWRLAERP